MARKLTVDPNPMLVPLESFHSIVWEMSLSSEPVAVAVRFIVDPCSTDCPWGVVNECY